MTLIAATNLARLQASSKTEQLSVRLGALASQLGAGAKLPTIIELRTSLGVSTTTLSAALNVLERQGVIERRHGVGIFVTTQAVRSRRIVLLCNAALLRGATHSPFWDVLVERAQARAFAGGESFECHFAQPAQPSRSAEAVLSRGVEEALRGGEVQGVLNVGLPRSAVQGIEAHGVPIVAFAGEGPYMVALDYSACVVDAARRLFEQGCRRLELWSNDFSTHSALRQALPNDVTPETAQPCSLPIERNDLARAVQTQTPQEWGYELAQAMSAEPLDARPDGVIISDDLMTHGALMAWRKTGVEVGRDLRLVTHANKGSSTLLGHDAPMLLMEVDPAEVVEAMFSTLESLMNGGTPAPMIVVSPRLREKSA